MRMPFRHVPTSRTLAATFVLVLAPAAAWAACTEAFVGETTTKVLGVISHIMVEKMIGATGDKIVGPYIDEALKVYLGPQCDAATFLEDKKAKVDSVLSSNAAAQQDVAVLQAQIALIQKELADYRALQQSTQDTQRQQISTSLDAAKTNVDNKLEQRSNTLEQVEANLEQVASRVEAPKAPAAAATFKTPSFNCANATTQTEHLICNNAQLGDIDGRLGEVYWELRKFVPPSESISVRNEERAWIKRRDQRLSAECMHGGGVDLPCVIGLWKERVDQLDAQLAAAKARPL